MVDVRGELAGQHVRARERQARPHAADRGGAVGGVAESATRPRRPARGVDLPDRLEVEVVGLRRCPSSTRCGLPAGVAERLAQACALLVERAALASRRARGRRSVDVRERRADRAVRVRSEGDAAAAGRVVPAPPVVVGSGARDRGVGGLEAERADLGSSPKTRRRVLEPMPSAATTRSNRSSARVLERDGDAAPGRVVVEAGDAVAEAVLGGAGGAVDEEPREVAAQDLELGGRTAASRRCPPGTRRPCRRRGRRTGCPPRRWSRRGCRPRCPSAGPPRGRRRGRRRSGRRSRSSGARSTIVVSQP